jgi:hypothetical protein
MNKALLQLYYDKGYELLCEYRRLGVSNVPEAIPTKEWYRHRLWDEAYQFWEKWKCSHVDVSDQTLNKKNNADKEAFIRRERTRLNYGLWVTDPNWDSYTEERRQQIKGEFPWAPYIQLLSPYHYFLVNYLMVSIKGRGTVRPTYFRRDALFWEVHDILENRTLAPRESRGMLVVFKTRGSHFSTTMITKCLRNLFVKDHDAYSIGVAIDTKEKIQQYAKKTIEIFNSVPNWIKPINPDTKQFLLRKPPTTSQDNARISMKFWDKKTKKEFPFANEVLVKGHIPQSWEDLRLDSFLIDEAGICAYDIQTLIDKGSACMRNEQLQQVGLTVVGGTSDAQNDRNNPTFTRIKDHPEKYNAFIFFSGAQHIGAPDEYGFTDEEIIKSEVHAERQRYREIGDIKKLVSITTINPVMVDDCLYISGSTHIDVERANVQKKRCSQLMNDIHEADHYTIRNGWFRENTLDYLNPVYVPDDKGGWHIIESPQGEIKRNGTVEPHYFAGIDNVDAEISLDAARKLNEENIGRLSKSCCVIMNLHTKKVVAYYLYRHTDPSQDYLQMLYGLLHYNCMGFVEGNKPKNIEFFKKHNAGGFPAWFFVRYLYRTPMVWGGNYMRRPNPVDIKYGLYTGPQKKKWYENYIIPYMEMHTEDIFFPELLEAMIRWNISGDKSPDIGMAFLICLMGSDDYTNSSEFTSHHQKNGRVQALYEMVNTYAKRTKSAHTWNKRG